MSATGDDLPTVTARIVDERISYLRLWLPKLSDGNDDLGFLRNLWFVSATEAVVSPVVIVLSSALWLASTACYRSLSRLREIRADAGAAAIDGSPAALAGALEALDDQRPEADLRTAETGVRELCVMPAPVAEGDPIDGDDVIARTRRRWRSLAAAILPRSHPPVEDRADALRERKQLNRQQTGA